MIDPHKLRDLRERKELTREQLAERAGLSERQIARIETSQGAFRARRSTEVALAKALGVDHEELCPSDANQVKQGAKAQHPQIRGSILKLLRTRKGLSVQALAECSSVSKRQIQRLESRDGLSRVRGFTLNRIAEALDVEASMLYLSDDPPEVDYRLGKPVAINGDLPTQVALAYDLVSLRYGTTMSEVVCLAPMLFALLADASLAWRSREVDRMAQMVGEFKAALDDSAKPYVLYGVNYEETWEAINSERDSIQQRDLTGQTRTGYCFEEIWGPDDNNPFLDYLRKVAEESGAQAVVDLSEVKPVSGLRLFPSHPLADLGGYKIDSPQLQKICGGSEDALNAVLFGDVRLQDIPAELLSEDATSERVEWLEGKLSAEVKKGLCDHESLKSWLDLHLSVPAR